MIWNSLSAIHGFMLMCSFSGGYRLRDGDCGRTEGLWSWMTSLEPAILKGKQTRHINPTGSIPWQRIQRSLLYCLLGSQGNGFLRQRERHEQGLRGTGWSREGGEERWDGDSHPGNQNFPTVVPRSKNSIRCFEKKKMFFFFFSPGLWICKVHAVPLNHPLQMGIWGIPWETLFNLSLLHYTTKIHTPFKGAIEISPWPNLLLCLTQSLPKLDDSGNI